MPKQTHSHTNWWDLSEEEFAKRCEEARAITARYTADIEALFPGHKELTDDQRAHAPRLKLGTEVEPNEKEPYGEHDVFLAVLKVADMRPETFKGMANKDKGLDPAKFETDRLRMRIRKHKQLTLLARQAQPATDIFSEGPLWLATDFADVCRTAYNVAKNLATIDDEVAAVMARAISYYSNIAKTAAATRNEKKQKPEE